MRSLVGTYLSIGIVLLVLGFLRPAHVRTKTGMWSATPFSSWGGGLPLRRCRPCKATAPQWLHRQACEGGVGSDHAALAR